LYFGPQPARSLGFINAADPNVDNAFAPFANPNDGSSPAVSGHLQTDDVGLLWLQDQSKSNVAGALLLSNPRLRPGTVEARVSTTQVAPTILEALDLDPRALDAVRKEGTKPLPGLGL